MFDYIRNAYKTIRDYYRTYSYSSDPSRKVNKIYAFFKSIFNYLFKKPKPIILSNEQRARFERGLDSKLTSAYDIEYRPNSIILRRKNLEGRL